MFLLKAIKKINRYSVTWDKRYKMMVLVWDFVISLVFKFSAWHSAPFLQGSAWSMSIFGVCILAPPRLNLQNHYIKIIEQCFFCYTIHDDALIKITRRLYIYIYIYIYTFIQNSETPSFNIYFKYKTFLFKESTANQMILANTLLYIQLYKTGWYLAVKYF